MECNKDEALRAKTIAEKKLADKDYAGAKKFCLKAQSLYPGIDGISQMMMTIEVYISGEKRIGGEKDWYAILDVAPSADDETIRKQYRRLALMLHPDKNKSVSADGAFKLVSEAWSLLSDKAKRLAYNQKRVSYGLQKNVAAQSTSPPAFQKNVAAQSKSPPTFFGVNGFNKFTNKATPKPKPKPKRGSTTTTRMAPPTVPPPPQQRTDTFWTICEHYEMHYEYLSMYLNSSVICPDCRQPFEAVKMQPPVNFPNPQPPPSVHQWRQNPSNFAPPNNPFGPGRNPATTPDLTPGSPFTKHVNAGTTDPYIAARAANIVSQVNERIKRKCEESSTELKRSKTDDVGHIPGVKIPFSSEKSSFTAGSMYGFSSKNRKDNHTRELTAAETRNMLMQRASVEIRREVSQWRLKKTADEGKVEMEGKKEKEQKSMKNKANVDSSGSKSGEQAETELDAAEIIVPDPDFHDFDLDRTEEAFNENQVWAAYDDEDGMPRFYALIQKVLSRNPFKMKISWLNSRTSTEFGPLNWIASGFYKTCGEFKVGRHEVYDSLNSFSHKAEWIKGARGAVLIFPRKGEVWALYRNWSPDWNMHTPDDVTHKYDMVEVLEDYKEEQGVSVIPLLKVTAFKTVFHPHPDRDQVKRIPKEEMFRFSHQVPKYLLTGKEAENVPKGCWELDPAATPLELLQATEECDATATVDDGTKQG